jgi:hypothetical protein
VKSSHWLRTLRLRRLQESEQQPKGENSALWMRGVGCSQQVSGIGI